jgi:hypothetical protein
MAKNRTITLIIVAVALAASILVPSTFLARNTGLAFEAHAQSLQAHHFEECSTASLQGTYVYRRTGINNDVGPVGGIGFFTADGEGYLSGTGTNSRNGQISQQTFEQTYVVNPDCTGSTFLTDGTLFSNFVLYRGGREYFDINMLPGHTITEEGKKQ